MSLSLLWAPLCYHAHGPIYNFGSNHDWDCPRMCCDWYDQQQHILIAILDPWDLEIDIHKPKVWDGRTPVPSYSNNYLRGWICSSRSSQNWELMLETWAPITISAVIPCLSTITEALSEHPLKWAMGTGLRKGTGGCCGWHQWGVGPHSLGSPWTGLKSWPGWHIPEPCGPSPGTKSTGENCGLSP